jgi:hypothetical protein
MSVVRGSQDVGLGAAVLAEVAAGCFAGGFCFGSGLVLLQEACC